MREERYFPYQISTKLGVGMFGEVCKVTRNNDSKSFAMKLMKGEMVRRNPRLVQMLNHEVTGMLGKYHPNIVSLYDAFKIKKDNFLIYELCESQSLKTRLKENGTWKEDLVLEMAKQMLCALQYIHGLGIIHRDIKPDNILMKSKEFKLADFGLCFRGGPHYDNDMIGSPAYLAPEILKSRYYSEKSDLYALGLSLFEMLYGKYPFDQKTESELMKKKFEFMPSKEYLPNCSKGMLDILRMMMHPIIEKRSTVDEMLKRLKVDTKETFKRMNSYQNEFFEEIAPEQELDGNYPPISGGQYGEVYDQQGYDYAGFADPNQYYQPQTDENVYPSQGNGQYYDVYPNVYGVNDNGGYEYAPTMDFNEGNRDGSNRDVLKDIPPAEQNIYNQHYQPPNPYEQTNNNIHLDYNYQQYTPYNQQYQPYVHNSINVDNKNIKNTNANAYKRCISRNRVTPPSFKLDQNKDTTRTNLEKDTKKVLMNRQSSMVTYPTSYVDSNTRRKPAASNNFVSGQTMNRNTSYKTINIFDIPSTTTSISIANQIASPSVHYQRQMTYPLSFTDHQNPFGEHNTIPKEFGDSRNMLLPKYFENVQSKEEAIVTDLDQEEADNILKEIAEVTDRYVPASDHQQYSQPYYYPNDNAYQDYNNYYQH